MSLPSTGIKVWSSLNWPNRISLMRLLLVAPFVVLLKNHQETPAARYVAIGIFVVMALSDMLDGILARRLNARTRLGAILDPLADKVLVICAVVLLSLPDSVVKAAPVPDWVVVFVVGKDLWVIIGFVVLYLATDRFLVRPTAAGKVCTLVQAAMISLVLLAPDINRIQPELGTILARSCFYIVVASCLAAGASYTRMGLGVVLREQKPLENQTSGNTDESQHNNGTD